MKTNINVGNSVAQKLAGRALTIKIRDAFKLHPHIAAGDIVQNAKNADVTPQEVLTFLEATLPGMVTEFLAETRVVLEKKLAEKRDPALKK